MAQLESTDFLSLSSQNSKTFLLNLIHQLEQLWDNRPKRKLLLDKLKVCLMSANAPDILKIEELKAVSSSLNQNLTIKQFLSIAVPLERKLGGSFSEHLYIIDCKDKKWANASEQTNPLFVIADNLRSAFNVGSIFRTSECIGAEHVYLCGYTAGPERSKTKKSAMGTEQLISWSWHMKAEEAIKNLQRKGIPCIALETAHPSTSIFEFDFPKSCGLVLGNERYGLDSDLLSICDYTVHIPVYGKKNSLNVGVSLAIAAYEYKRQHQSSNIINAF